MPKIRRKNFPRPVLEHLLRRMRERSISKDQIILLSRWLDTEPEAPEGKWYKMFPDFALCGEGELPKTFLVPGQLPEGKEIN